MGKLLAGLVYVVVRRRFRRFGCRSVARALERDVDPTQVEPETSNRSLDPLVAVGGVGRNRVWRVVSNFRSKLSDLVYLRTDCGLDRVSIHAARNRDWHFCSFGNRNLGNAPRIWSVHPGNKKPIALDAAMVDGRAHDHSDGDRGRDW